MHTDTSERGVERLICTALTGHACDAGSAELRVVAERPATYSAGWVGLRPQDYDRELCVDLVQLAAFLPQPEVAEAVDIDHDGPTRRKFLARLQGVITRDGTIDVLRHGLNHGSLKDVQLFYGTPSADNTQAAERFAATRFSVTRQVRYSRDETRRSLDLVLFVNGLPIATFGSPRRREFTPRPEHPDESEFEEDSIDA